MLILSYESLGVQLKLFLKHFNENCYSGCKELAKPVRTAFAGGT